MTATVRVVDLSNVKEGGGFRPRRKPEGDYRAKIVKADDHKKEGKTPGWVLTIQIEGDARSTYPQYLSPDANQAWKIAQVCRAAGLKVPTGKVRFDPNKVVGKAIGVFLEDDEYEGRLKSVVAEMFPVSEVGANADEGDEEIIDEEEIEEEEEEEEAAPPPRKRTARKRAPEPEPEEDEEEDEEEEAAPPPPRKRARAKKAAPPPPDDDEDEDEDLDDIDLDDLDDE